MVLLSCVYYKIQDFTFLSKVDNKRNVSIGCFICVQLSQPKDWKDAIDSSPKSLDKI